MRIERLQALLNKKVKKATESNNAVIYTRVSTSKQIDNTSLEFQREQCIAFCQKNKYNVAAEFGGTYESAKSDNDRPEFQRMLEFVKNKKNNIALIVAYSPDRFSRSGPKADILVDELFVKHGVIVTTVTQPISDNSAMGKAFRSIAFVFSNLDNNIRKEKVTSGMKEKLRQGYCMFKAPIGYSKSAQPGVPVPNPKAKFIRKAFDLKMQGKSHDVIARLLALEGFSINIRRLTDIFSNPFYCGVITHSLIEWEWVKGKHEPIISAETFEL